MARRVVLEFLDAVGGSYTKFHYAPFLLAGLLRFRNKEPRALLFGSDLMGNDLYEATNLVLQDLKHGGGQSENFGSTTQKYLPILEDLKSYLEGEGENPDLLLNIYNSS